MVALSFVAIPTTMPTEFLTPWALLIITDPRKRRAVRRLFERAEFAVEAAATVEEVVDLLAVMTPAVIVADPPVTLPGPGNLLDRSRTVGVDAAGDGDGMRQKLTLYREGNGGQLFRKA